MRNPGPQQITSELVATVLTVAVREGEPVDAGDELVLLESMKMEIPVLAEAAGTVLEVTVAPGDVVQDGDILVVIS